jgi:NosR/NirI family nitrous oxide reductase transcriptional regulator
MKKYKINRIVRIIIQILFLILLPGLVALAFSEVKLFFTDLLALKFVKLFTDCALLIVLIVSTILLGRFFCGWMCIFGAYNDWVYLVGQKLFKIKYRVDKNVDKYLKYVKYIILVFIGLLVWTNIIKIPSGASVFGAYGSLLNPSLLFSDYLIGFILLILITIGCLFIERFFCRYLCPMGAIFSIVSRGRILRISKKKSNCGNCKACSLKCSMGIDLDSMDEVKSGECINCFNCIAICPKANSYLELNKKKVNEYAVGVAALAGTTGLYLGMDKLASNISGNSTSTSEVTTSKYNDGTYTGTGVGYRGEIEVKVTIKNGKITSINLVSDNDTPDFFNRAWDYIPNNIISSQSTSVDTVSGATYSSNGIIEAVDDALKEALKTNSSTTSNEENTDSSNTTNTETNTTNSETTESNTTTNSEDTTSTTSSTYKDGTYTGSGYGYKGEIQVAVVISGGKITSINLISDNDTPNFFNRAWGSIPDSIVSSQSTSVDTISGATYSSRGIIEAVNSALEQAK